MATKVNNTTFAGMLKIFYVDAKKVHDVAKMQNKPFLGLVPKEPSAGGATWNAPILSDAPTGGGASFSSGSADYTLNSTNAFAGDYKDHWEFIGFDDKTIAASENAPKVAFQKAQGQIDRIVERFKSKVSFKLYRTESGSIGQLSAAAANTGSLTAGTVGSAMFVENGDKLVVATTATGGTLRGGGKAAVVDKVLRESGQIGAANGWPASTAANDFVFWMSDHAYITENSKPPSIAGLADWVPDTAPTDTWKGVNRATDPDRLAGIRLAGLGSTVEEAIIEVIHRIVQYGGRPDAVFLHPRKMSILVKELSTRGRIVVETRPGASFSKKGLQAAFSFSAVQVARPDGGMIDVYADPACPIERGYVVTLGSLELASMKEVPHFRLADGMKMLRDTTSGYRTDLVSYHELLCYAPVHNGVIKFDSAT